MMKIKIKSVQCLIKEIIFDDYAPQGAHERD
jgi:hypothetical protein